MTKMNQKEAVFQAVNQVLTESNVIIDFGESYKSRMTKEHRAQVNAILFQGFKAGEIELTKEYTDSQLKEYVSGLQTNWLNKDTRLNGGTKHVAKNPGSRAGSSDPQIKALKALMSTKNDAEEIAEIQAYIDARQSELNVGKTKTVNVNFDDLPEELKAKYSAK